MDFAVTLSSLIARLDGLGLVASTLNARALPCAPEMPPASRRRHVHRARRWLPTVVLGKRQGQALLHLGNSWPAARGCLSRFPAPVLLTISE